MKGKGFLNFGVEMAEVFYFETLWFTSIRRGIKCYHFIIYERILGKVIAFHLIESHTK